MRGADTPTVPRVVNSVAVAAGICRPRGPLLVSSKRRAYRIHKAWTRCVSHPGGDTLEAALLCEGRPPFPLDAGARELDALPKTAEEKDEKAAAYPWLCTLEGHANTASLVLTATKSSARC